MPSQQTFVIGLDAFDRNLVESLLAAGELPCIGRLFAEGISGNVKNPRWFEPGASWLDFYYGVSLGTHGQFDGMLRFDGSTYRKRLLNYDEQVADAFWKVAGKAGKSVAVIDAPYALLEPEINGVHVTDWLSHVFRSANIRTNPASLGPAIIREFGDNPFDRRGGCPANWVELETAEQIIRFRDQLTDRSMRKAACCKKLIRENPWDLFCVVFQEAHDIGHMGWHLHDKSHERHDPTIAEEVGDPVKDVYRAIDKAVGQLLEEIPDTANVLLYSNIGMGTEISATDFFGAILQRLDRLYRGADSAISGDDSRSGKTSLFSLLYSRLVPRYVRKLLGKTPFMRRRYENYHAKTRSRCRFFELAAHHAVGGVRINLAGREQFGIVKEGREYDELCQRIIGDLSQIINSETGQPLARKIMLSSGTHAGDMTHNLPDIIVEWDRSGPIRQVRSEKIGTMNNSSDRNRTGDHENKDGFFICRRPGKPSARLERPVDAIDFMPTICSLSGVPFRSEGEVIPELGP